MYFIGIGKVVVVLIGLHQQKFATAEWILFQ
jgi:hypothetical protein